MSLVVCDIADQDGYRSKRAVDIADEGGLGVFSGQRGGHASGWRSVLRVERVHGVRVAPHPGSPVALQPRADGAVAALVASAAEQYRGAERETEDLVTEADAEQRQARTHESIASCAL